MAQFLITKETAVATDMAAAAALAADLCTRLHLPESRITMQLVSHAVHCTGDSPSPGAREKLLRAMLEVPPPEESTLAAVPAPTVRAVSAALAGAPQPSLPRVLEDAALLVWHRAYPVAVAAHTKMGTDTGARMDLAEQISDALSCVDARVACPSADDPPPAADNLPADPLAAYLAGSWRPQTAGEGGGGGGREEEEEGEEEGDGRLRDATGPAREQGVRLPTGIAGRKAVAFSDDAEDRRRVVRRVMRRVWLRNPDQDWDTRIRNHYEAVSRLQDAVLPLSAADTPPPPPLLAAQWRRYLQLREPRPYHPYTGERCPPDVWAALCAERAARGLDGPPLAPEQYRYCKMGYVEDMPPLLFAAMCKRDLDPAVRAVTGAVCPRQLQESGAAAGVGQGWVLDAGDDRLEAYAMAEKVVGAHCGLPWAAAKGFVLPRESSREECERMLLLATGLTWPRRRPRITTDAPEGDDEGDPDLAGCVADPQTQRRWVPREEWDRERAAERPDRQQAAKKPRTALEKAAVGSAKIESMFNKKN